MEMVMVWQWEIVVPCRILGRSWRKGTASWKPRSNENIGVYQHQASFQAGFEAAPRGRPPRLRGLVIA